MRRFSSLPCYPETCAELIRAARRLDSMGHTARAARIADAIASDNPAYVLSAFDFMAVSNPLMAVDRPSRLARLAVTAAISLALIVASPIVALATARAIDLISF